MKKYDALIVGAGHKVLVLERRELVGGCAVTEEIWPGYRVSTAAYLTSVLQERTGAPGNTARACTSARARCPGNGESYFARLAVKVVGGVP
jgi:hypothetical protein